MRLIALTSILFFSVIANAAPHKLLGRVTFGQGQTDFTELNPVMAGHGIQDFKNLNKVGIEVTYPVLEYLELGGRFEQHTASRPSISGSTTTDGSISQDTLEAIVRVPFVKNSYFRMDVFGGYGASNTTIKIYSPSETGKFRHTGADKWNNAIVSSYGLSAAVGVKGISLYTEVGYQSNVVETFEKTGNLSSTLDRLDLSGPYASVGLLLDGSYLSVGGR